MSRFFVGQRVRVVGTEWNTRPENPRPHPRGKEGRIVGRGPVVGPVSGKTYEWVVEVPDQVLMANSDQLEPILPSGQVAITLQQLLGVPGLESLEKILGTPA